MQTHRCVSYFLTLSARVIAVVVFLGFLTALPAFGQMGSSGRYSDAWLAGSSTYNQPPRIVGMGSTQDNYNMYGHTYWVVASLRSPTGRTASATSYSSNAYSAYVRIELSLPWSDADAGGQFNLTTEHWMRCPYMYGAFPQTLGFPFTVGSSVLCYQFNGFVSTPPVEGFNYEYRVISQECLLRTYCGNTYIYTPESYGMFGLAQFYYFRFFNQEYVLCIPVIQGTFKTPPGGRCTLADCTNQG